MRNRGSNGGRDEPMKSHVGRSLLTVLQIVEIGVVLGPLLAGAQLPPRAYVAAPDAGYLRVIEGAKEIPIVPPFPLGPAPSDVAVHPLGTSVYVSDVDDDT